MIMFKLTRESVRVWNKGCARARCWFLAQTLYRNSKSTKVNCTHELIIAMSMQLQIRFYTTAYLEQKKKNSTVTSEIKCTL